MGLEVIANLMGRCAIYETLYLGNGTTSAVKFGEAIVELYTHILRYLIRAGQYYSKNTAGVYFKLFKPSRCKVML